MKAYFGVAALILTIFSSSNTVAAESPFKWSIADGQGTLQVGGFVRTNYRDEHWESDNNGKFLFDNARLNIKGTYKDWFLDSSYAFLDDHKRAIEHAYLGYHVNQNNDVLAGYIYKPFGIFPFPEHAWTFPIPFFLGFADSSAPGINWHYFDDRYDLNAAYMPVMGSAKTHYAPETGASDDIQFVLPSQREYTNEKRNQINLRASRKFQTAVGKQEIGLSAAVAQYHNKTTDKDGSYQAFGVHAVNNYHRLDFQTGVIRYEYDSKNPDGVSDDVVLFGSTGLTPAYLVAAKGTIGYFNVGYTLPVSTTYFPNLKTLKFYNDYSILSKDKSGWSDSQMNTLGVQFNAMPFLIWFDYTIAKNVNAIGGANNSTGYTSTTSPYSNDWKSRFNINIGYNF